MAEIPPREGRIMTSVLMRDDGDGQFVAIAEVQSISEKPISLEIGRLYFDTDTAVPVKRHGRIRVQYGGVEVVAYVTDVVEIEHGVRRIYFAL